ncbi:MAG TPA: glycosyl hydrolase family 39 [Terriglobales bacterium]|nr:glycosyl hydrolase family 39 [Terriglobales bacterium]
MVSTEPRVLLLGLLLMACGSSLFAQSPPSVVVNWTKTTPNHTTPTLQAVVNPMLRRGSPIHDAAFAALRKLGCDYVRYAFWFPYPKLVVAELRPPDANQTYWDFQYMDPLVEDFLTASDEHPSVWSFSTIPQWLFTTPQPVVYPDDPNQVIWNYSQGNELRDVPALANYYARLASWYTQGGFTDELGKFHASGHHYDMRYWEVFNEIDGEHEPTPEQYVERYDAIADAVRKVVPEMKFVALALSYPEGLPRMFEYFLDPKNHKPGIPLDYVSFHVYAAPSADQTLDQWQYTFFDRANEFLAATRYILRLRDRLSPSTKIMINEAGSILAGDMVQGEPHHVEKPIPPAYWNLSGALYAYLYVQLAQLGVDVVGESQLVGFPSQFPSVSMVDWTNGKPNARLTILELLKNNLGPGDDFAETEMRSTGTPEDADAITAQAYIAGHQRKLVLINQRNREVVVELPKECLGSGWQTIGGASPDLVQREVGDTKLRLQAFSVSIVTLKD